jgi:hypothetical protein
MKDVYQSLISIIEGMIFIVMKMYENRNANRRADTQGGDRKESDLINTMNYHHKDEQERNNRANNIQKI